MGMSKKLTTEEFIEKSKLIHNDKYNYLMVEYKNTLTKINIICKEHGLFSQLPKEHLKGKGCICCSGRKRSNIEDFIKKANRIHKNTYDYSMVEYINNKSKIVIACKEHGQFNQIVRDHLRGSGCPLCYGNKKSNTLNGGREGPCLLWKVAAFISAARFRTL
jgi:hypothetical protein